jgi:hypothetical protein
MKEEEKIDPKEVQLFNLGYELQKLAPEIAEDLSKAITDKETSLTNKAFQAGKSQLNKELEGRKKVAKYEKSRNYESPKIIDRTIEKFRSLDKDEKGIDRDK